MHDARTTTFTEQRYHFDLPNFDGRAADMCLTADGTLHVLAVAPLVLYSFKKPSAGASTAWCAIQRPFSSLVPQLAKYPSFSGYTYK